MEYEIKNVNGHYEVYVNGKLYCTADNMEEVMKELVVLETQVKGDSYVL